MVLGFKEVRNLRKVGCHTIKVTPLIVRSPRIVGISCDPRPGVKQATAFHRSYEGQHS